MEGRLIGMVMGTGRNEKNWRQDRENGLWTWWNARGRKIKEGSYKDGQKHGIWAIYDSRGRKMEENQWKNGELSGKSFLWDQRGKKIVLKTYLRKFQN